MWCKHCRQDVAGKRAGGADLFACPRCQATLSAGRVPPWIVNDAEIAEAVARMHRALSETVIEGVKTTIPFHLKLLADPTFLAGEFSIPRFEQHV